MRIGQAATAALAVGIVTVGGVGVATAANGQPVLLGHSNKASSVTVIKSSHGSALILRSSAHAPSLTVSNKEQIPHLNASYLDGLTANQIKAAVKPSAGAAVTQVLAEMSEGSGSALCPSGMKPVGGGVLPDIDGATDIPFVVASFPHLTTGADGSTITDGWQGVAADTNGTYNGSGFVFAMCEAGTFTQTTSLRPAGATERATRNRVLMSR